MEVGKGSNSPISQPCFLFFFSAFQGLAEAVSLVIKYSKHGKKVIWKISINKVIRSYFSREGPRFWSQQHQWLAQMFRSLSSYSDTKSLWASVSFFALQEYYLPQTTVVMMLVINTSKACSSTYKIQKCHLLSVLT